MEGLVESHLEDKAKPILELELTFHKKLHLLKDMTFCHQI